jgi:diphthine methyl ester synthase
LETLYGAKIEIADREMVESQSDAILEDAKDSNVAFCVVGDPFGATTHADLMLRAREGGVKVEVIHNASIMNAIAACGLQLYRFGQVRIQRCSNTSMYREHRSTTRPHRCLRN